VDLDACFGLSGFLPLKVIARCPVPRVSSSKGSIFVAKAKRDFVDLSI